MHVPSACGRNTNCCTASLDSPTTVRLKGPRKYHPPKHLQENPFPFIRPQDSSCRPKVGEASPPARSAALVAQRQQYPRRLLLRWVLRLHGWLLLQGWLLRGG